MFISPGNNKVVRNLISTMTLDLDHFTIVFSLENDITRKFTEMKFDLNEIWKKEEIKWFKICVALSCKSYEKPSTLAVQLL